MKYSTKIVHEVEAWVTDHGLMEYGGAKMQDYCMAMGIHDKTHRNWLRQYKEYGEAIERGKAAFKTAHTQKLFGTLMEAAMGGVRETEDENTEYRANPDNPNKPIIHRMTRQKRKTYVRPDTTAAIFLICNLDPEHFQQRQRNEIAVKKPTNEEKLSIEEIEAEIKRLME